MRAPVLQNSNTGTVALLIVDHGSRIDDANATLVEVAALVRSQLEAQIIVKYAHMELAPPDIRSGFSACVREGASHIIVHPYMLAAGRHATRDIPALVAAAGKDHPDVTYAVSDPIGVHPLLARIIIERANIRR